MSVSIYIRELVLKDKKRFNKESCVYVVVSVNSEEATR